MWEKIVAFSASFIQISNVLLKNQKDIDELQEQVADLQTDMKLLAQRLDHFTEMERAHHRSNLLELENRILQMERRLPPN